MDCPPGACLVSESAAVHVAMRADKRCLLPAAWLLFTSTHSGRTTFSSQSLRDSHEGSVRELGLVVIALLSDLREMRQPSPVGCNPSPLASTQGRVTP